jgi:RNA polymerase sigma-70 factor (ECF subfamily)
MQSDRALMRRIGQGDDEAATELVLRHGGRMKRVAARLLGSPADAEDAVQRAFVQCLTAAATYRPEWAVSTWLYRILSNICVDEIRRRRVRLRIETEDPDDARNGRPGPAGRRTADSTGARIDLQRALAKVPTEARLLLVLRYVDGLSYGELARVRGISVNTVKSQLARGKSILRTALEEGRT